MKSTLPRSLVLGLAFTANLAFMSAAEWRSLLTSDLAAWEIWVGVPHVSVPIEWAGKGTDGRTGTPLGLGRNERGSYTVGLDSGEPVLRVSGEFYAGLTSLEEFGDYHLRFEFIWGETKWPPRLDRLRDSGLLYHCTDAHGAFWNFWLSWQVYRASAIPPVGSRELEGSSPLSAPCLSADFRPGYPLLLAATLQSS